MGLKRFSLLVCFSFAFSVNASAQAWELGINTGAAGYIGDLNPINPLKLSGVNLGAFARYNFTPYWALGFNYNYGKIKASDSKSNDEQLINRNLSFFTPLNELSLLVDFNFFDYFSGGGYRRFTPYLQAGFGGLIFEPKTEYQGDTYLLKTYKTEGQADPYKNYTFSLIYGGGIKYNFSEKWTLTSQVVYRNAYTDYLDDVSGSYVDLSSNQNNFEGRTNIVLADRSPEIGQPRNTPGTMRGDFRKRDNYMFVGFGISYTFVSQKCYY